MHQANVAIIGGGIIGLATAYQFLRQFPQQRVLVLEKEASLAFHQTGRNSGVLHSGIYYKPGTLRATNCRTGKEAMEKFCQAEGVPFEICGKVIVAVTADEFPALERIYQRGQANGVRAELINQARLKELEPHAAGLRAIHVPEAGIVDYGQVCQRLGPTYSRGRQPNPLAIPRDEHASPRPGHTARDDGRRRASKIRGELRWPAVRSCHGDERRATRGQDRAVSRRVLRAEAGRSSSVPQSDLSGPQPELSVFRCAFYAA